MLTQHSLIIIKFTSMSGQSLLNIMAAWTVLNLNNDTDCEYTKVKWRRMRVSLLSCVISVLKHVAETTISTFKSSNNNNLIRKKCEQLRKQQQRESRSATFKNIKFLRLLYLYILETCIYSISKRDNHTRSSLVIYTIKQ